MAIPELEAKRVETLLSRFCEERIPPHARHQVQLLYRKRGNAITLYERRPYYLDESQHTEMPIAKFQYDPKGNHWSLKWADRNDRWHHYEDFTAVRDFKTLLDKVSADPTRIFWG